MNRMTVSTLHIATPTAPRGARWAAALYIWLASAFKPATKRPLTRGEEAAPVRALAYSVQHNQPGFAADLFAAAARHESKDDI